MEEIIRFVSLAQTDRFTITELCEQFGISRKTAEVRLKGSGFTFYLDRLTAHVKLARWRAS